MTDLREDMKKAIEAQIKQLAHLRGCRYVDAAVAVAQSYSANLVDSRDTSMESYWQQMVTIADGVVTSELGTRP